MATTSSPRSSNARHRCDPRKPAPPETTILDTVRHRTRVLSRRLQRRCSRFAATSPDDASTGPPQGGHVKYHPILLMIDEDRLAGTTKSTALAHAGIDAVRDYALWLADRVAASGIRSCAIEAHRLAL